jgi:anti-anti-sigma factor
MGQRIQCNDVAGVTVVRFLGEHLLESRGLEETYGELLGVVETEARDNLVLDFSTVHAISAAGVGRLLALKKKLHARGGELTLRNVGQQVYQVFVVTKLARYFGLPDN